jgi:hypothetical protein
MMPSRDVVRDLLPLYVAGEASPDSVKLVDRVGGERVALVRIREAVRTRSVLLGIAIFLTLAPFSFFYAGGQVKLFALRDAPGMAIPALVAGAGCWVGWFLLGRRISRNA